MLRGLEWEWDSNKKGNTSDCGSVSCSVALLVSPTTQYMSWKVFRLATRILGTSSTDSPLQARHQNFEQAQLYHIVPFLCVTRKCHRTTHILCRHIKPLICLYITYTVGYNGEIRSSPVALAFDDLESHLPVFFSCFFLHRSGISWYEILDFFFKFESSYEIYWVITFVR